VLRPTIENLETRLVPTVSAPLPGPIALGAGPPVLVRPSFQLLPVASPRAPSGSEAGASPQSFGSTIPYGFSPAQIRTAYGISAIVFANGAASGAGQTIAIVDAYDDPHFQNSSSPSFSTSDLARFDQQYGLPDPPSFVKLNEYGGTSLPGTDPAGAGNPQGNWELEEALDVEWAHAIAPGASIVLIECTSASGADMYQGVTTAAALAGVSVVSMSWGSSEFLGEQSYDTTFRTPAGHQGVTFVASTGDSGSPGEYPAYSPNVVAAGGTSLYLNTNNSYNHEIAWSGSGGGVSAYESEPSDQQGAQSTGRRTIPDVSFDADPNTGVSVYDSYNGTSNAPWIEVGGTSLSAPSWAGLLAIADAGRLAAGGTTLDGPSQALPALYGIPNADFHDIMTGSNGGFSAGPGYDEVTGRGTPVANALAPDLAASGAATGALVTVIVTQPPAAITAGSTFGLTAWVENAQGGLDSSFNGLVTVTLGNDPGGATLGGTLSVTAQGGVATFSGLSITHAAAGYTLVASAAGSSSATTNAFTVTPAAPTRLAMVVQPPGKVTLGAAFGMVVAVEDNYGNVEANYSGQVAVALAKNPGKAVLGGTLSVAVKQGEATFTNLTLNKIASGYTILASSGKLSPATTAPFSVVAAVSKALPAHARIVRVQTKHATRPGHWSLVLGPWSRSPRR
jgi:subtilase family serine protease